MSKLKLPAALALALLLGDPASAEPVTYRLDPAFSFVDFEVAHFGTSLLRGRFGPVEGEVVLDRRAQRGEVGLRIALDSVSTGWRALDTRLRAPDLLATDDEPTAYFVATAFRFDGSSPVEVRGEFTLRGVSRPLTLQGVRFGCHKRPPDGAEVCGGDFEASLLRSDFGADFGLPLVGDRVRLQVRVEGVRHAGEQQR